MNNLKNIFTLLLLAVCGNLFSQTVNTGVMYVSPGTEFSTVGAFDNTETGEFYNDGEAYIYSHFNNDGIVDFYDGGFTRFQGLFGAQEISGISRSYLYNVLFKNDAQTAPFHLSGTISVAGTSNFDVGIVDNDSYGGSFIFERSAGHINTSDYSHVDGFVMKEGDSEFLYPIGDGGYFRYAAISAPGAATDEFEAKYFLENSNTIYPHTNKEEHIELIDNSEYWIVNRVNSNTDVMLTLSWRSETTPFEIIDTPYENNIHIVRWDSSQQMWIDEGGITDEAVQTVTASVTGYGVFTLAKVKEIEEDDDSFVIFNGLTPGDDGLNDIFRIQGIENYPDNNVMIFNRWQVKVFERDGYNNDDVAFKGVSEGRATILQNEELPTGTYYYVIRFRGENPGKSLYTGYLYINR